MSEEWNWNSQTSSETDSDQENKIEETQTLQEDGAKETQILSTENVSGKEETDESKEEKIAEELEGSSEENVSGNTAVNEQGTYHWVNPEYQKRQQNASSAEQNTYQSSNYRESIGAAGQDAYQSNAQYQQGTQNAGYTQNTSYNPYNQNSQNRGYYGGSYHGDWKNQQAINQQSGMNQNTYETYHLSPDASKKKEKKKVRSGNKILPTIGLALLFGVVAGTVMFGVNKLGNHFFGDDQQAEEITQIPSVQMPETVVEDGEEASETVASAADTYTVAQVANNCMPSVVSITNASVSTVRDFFGGVQEYPVESSGSGIIVGQNETELLIATNNHVVDGAESITVAFCDDSVYEAQTKGKSSDNDLAVIAVSLSDMTQETLSAIRVITLGDSDALQIGEQVVAIGNALGYGQSVTSGWVSAVNRQVEDEDGNVTGNLIQTDAAINPGNSGGALLNMRGELIGINSAKAAATEVEGMGYAIPISIAEPILDELMNRETRYKVDDNNAAYIGVTCMDVEATATQMYGIPGGAFIDSVEENGPAHQAGIQKGDVIVKFDNQTVGGSSELVGMLEYYSAGESIEVVIARAENGEYKEITLTVTLGRKSEMKQTIE